METFDFYEIKKQTSRIRINACGILNHPQNWEWDADFSDYDLWFATKSGATFRYEDDSHPILSGTCVLFTPGSHIIGEAEPTDPAWHIYVHFDFLDGEGKVFHPLENAILNRTISDIPFFKSTLSRVLRLFNTNKKSQAESLLWAALSEFCEEESGAAFAPFGRDKFPIVQEICDSIVGEPSKTPSLSDLSHLYGYSSDYIGRFFTAYIGMSIFEYSASVRINRAKYLLKSSTLSVHEIAQALGYWDACYFSRQFKKVTGLSPLQYRKKHSG